VRCVAPGGCGLLQLEHTFSLPEMYGENYGYRSGLNASMVRHLRAKVERILTISRPPQGSVVLDIGSNDGTTLAAYPEGEFTCVGIDPSARKFRRYYRSDAVVIEDFFSRNSFELAFGSKKASIVTSFSMFYDLEAPLEFAREVASVLADDGMWVFEQSYMPLMLERNSYDTVCHEHLEYYSMRQIQWILQAIGMKAVDLEFNDVNGGSFSVAAVKISNPMQASPLVEETLQKERALGLDGPAPYRAFAERVAQSREDLRRFVATAHAEGKRVAALGASTKGNVLLQYCDFGVEDIAVVGEVNEDKFGAWTPGTRLPIQPEATVLEQGYDYYIVLPWHFRSTFQAKHPGRGAKLIFPLPELTVV
jgi:NDP-4-keto-2,6-dideoxyhexose 3-C-methyltransferase